MSGVMNTNYPSRYITLTAHNIHLQHEVVLCVADTQVLLGVIYNIVVDCLSVGTQYSVLTSEREQYYLCLACCRICNITNTYYYLLSLTVYIHVSRQEQEHRTGTASQTLHSIQKPFYGIRNYYKQSSYCQYIFT